MGLWAQALALSSPDINDAELLAGAPRGFDGAIHLISREGEEEEIFRGGEGFKFGQCLSSFPGEPGIAISHDEYGAFRGAVAIEVNDEVEFIEGRRLGERFGERLVRIPDLDGDGQPDLIATVRYVEGFTNDRGTVYLPSSNWQGRSPVLRVGNTGSTLGESIVWGSLLGDDPVVFAYGAPGYSDGNRNNSGAVYLVNRNGQVIGGPFPGAAAGQGVGRRMDTYRRPGQEQDWLVAGGTRAGKVELWRFDIGDEGVGISERVEVSIDDAGNSFGYSLAVSQVTEDGRSLLYVGEPESGNRGRVHVFWIR